MELVNPARGIHDLLFARVKRMACRANLYIDVSAHYGTGLKAVAAAASYSNLFVFRMNFWFHDRQTPCSRKSFINEPLAKLSAVPAVIGIDRHAREL